MNLLMTYFCDKIPLSSFNTDPSIDLWLSDKSNKRNGTYCPFRSSNCPFRFNLVCSVLSSVLSAVAYSCASLRKNAVHGVSQEQSSAFSFRRKVTWRSSEVFGEGGSVSHAPRTLEILPQV